MSRPLALPERQVTALCRGAAKAGCIAEVKIGNVVVRLIPKSDIPEKPVDASNDDDLDAEWSAFEAKHGHD